MSTSQDALHKIEMHEKECAIRYQNIEKRLDEGSEKFKKLENMLWGVYPFMVGAIVLTKFLQMEEIVQTYLFMKEQQNLNQAMSLSMEVSSKT